MLQAIELVRKASHDSFEKEKVPMFEAGFPALKRGISFAPVCTGLQLTTFEKEEENDELVLINTNDQNVIVEEDNTIAFCDKSHKTCGHACRGVANERHCLPCLSVDCA